MRIIVIAVTFFLLASMANAQQAPLFDKLLFNFQNDTLPYRLLKPVNPQALDSFPLVIFLHGAGERGNDNEVQIKHITELFLDERNRGKYPCYVVAPQCPKGKTWANFNRTAKGSTLRPTPSDPMKAVVALIDQVIKEFPIDKSRIYIMGLSMGGYGTWDLLARYPQRFAAAVPVCGGGDVKTAPIFKNVPLWAFHGALDKVVLPQESRKMIQALHEAGSSPGYTEYPDIEHNSWVYAFREPHLLPWLFDQKIRLEGSK